MIVEQNSFGSYRLKDSQGKILPQSFPADHLKPVTHQFAPAAEIYDVEKILAHKTVKNIDHYLVKWKGYDNSHNTWEPLENFNELRPIRIFWQSQQSNSRKKKLALAMLEMLGGVDIGSTICNPKFPEKENSEECSETRGVTMCFTKNQ